MSLTSPEIRRLQWRKARASAGNGACVEVAHAGSQILIRDSRSQEGPVIHYPASSWHAFVGDAKNGQFDLDHL
jgi:hypothetical protein